MGIDFFRVAPPSVLVLSVGITPFADNRLRLIKETLPNFRLEVDSSGEGCKNSLQLGYYSSCDENN